MASADDLESGGFTTSRRSFLGTSAAATGVVAVARWLVIGAAQGAERSDAKAGTQPVAHPFDPLTAEEIERAVAALRKHKPIGESWRFVSVALAEPRRQITSRPPDPVPRTALLVVMDPSMGRAFEAIVDSQVRIHG